MDTTNFDLGFMEPENVTSSCVRGHPTGGDLGGKGGAGALAVEGIERVVKGVHTSRAWHS